MSAPSDPAPRKPRAFRLEEASASPPRGAPVIEDAPDPYAREAEALAAPQEAAIAAAQRAGVVRRTLFTWGGLFWSALTGIFLMAIGLWFTQIVEDLFRRAPALGYAGLALVALIALALLVLAARELRGISRQRHIAKLHAALNAAREKDDGKAARAQLSDLLSLYGARPDAARARQHVESAMGEIIDGRDLIDIAERDLMTPLDEQVKREIATAAKRVSVVTAISPRAIVDVLFVAAQTLRLVRRIAEIYGGRPGALGFFKLLRSVIAHLAITGGMAAGDELLQQFLGHSLAARLSARLGEGVMNGLLTTRVGLSAMAICRPMPFAALETPRVNDVAPFLFSSKKDLAKDVAA